MTSVILDKGNCDYSSFVIKSLMKLFGYNVSFHALQSRTFYLHLAFARNLFFADFGKKIPREPKKPSFRGILHKKGILKMI